jgi:hypothetical protein
MMNPLHSSMLNEARRNDLFAEAEAARKVAEAKAAREVAALGCVPPRWRETRAAPRRRCAGRGGNEATSRRWLEGRSPRRVLLLVTAPSRNEDSEEVIR